MSESQGVGKVSSTDLEKAVTDLENGEMVMEEKKVRTIPTVNVFWTGGFDSTALVLRLLKEGKEVQPIYMKHSGDWGKCDLELAAQNEIRAYIGNPPALRNPIIWDHDQLISIPATKRLAQALDELALALHISLQYSAIRFCRDAVDWQGEGIALSIVEHDELWERIISTNAQGSQALFSKTLMNFFSGFELPLFNDSKKSLWMAATPQDREVLKKTYCCEHITNDRRSCIDRKVLFEHRCTPCKRRIEALW